MTDDPFATKNDMTSSELSRRDQALARVAGIMSGGRAPRPQSSLKEREIFHEVVPINIHEVAEQSPVVSLPRPIQPQAAPAPAETKPPEKAAAPVEKRGSPAHWFFQILILLFVLVWVFILGIFIGRGYLMESSLGRDFIGWIEETIGRQPETPAISVEEPPAEAPPLPVPEAPAPAAEPEPVAEAPAPLQPPIVEPPQAPQGTAPESAVLDTVTSSAQSVGQEREAEETAAESVAEGDSQFLTPETLAQEPEPEPAPAAPTEYIPPPPASLPIPNQRPVVDTLSYAVQATYALTEQAAQSVTDRLKRQGFQAYYYENSRGQYLIRVGHFETVEEARAAREKLTGLGYKDPYISRLEPE